MMRHLSLIDDDEMTAVVDDICNCYGVEDISLRHDLPEQEIRDLVRHLRNTESLKDMLEKPDV